MLLWSAMAQLLPVKWLGWMAHISRNQTDEITNGNNFDNFCCHLLHSFDDPHCGTRNVELIRL